MQDYHDFAEKNGIDLIDTGPCQFCGAQTNRGIHECLEIFNLGFQSIDYNLAENHKYRFFIVDAHALQHPEIHGRWSNHFHLTRLHLIIKYEVDWRYDISSKLSDHLNLYKKDNNDEKLVIPSALNRGSITTTDILKASENETECREMIKKWALEVYSSWKENHDKIDQIARTFNVV